MIFAHRRAAHQPVWLRFIALLQRLHGVRERAADFASVWTTGRPRAEQFPKWGFERGDILLTLAALGGSGWIYT
jgi:hypothetical protein